MGFNDNREAVIEALEDSGCSEDLIEDFLQLQENGCLEKQLKLLSKQRRVLLEHMHLYQTRIDCLDYLMMKMRREMQNDQ